MSASNDALAMTADQREKLDAYVSQMISHGAENCLDSEVLLVLAHNHIRAVEQRNLNFGNAYRELEAKVTAIAEIAWNQGYDVGLEVHYEDEDADIRRTQNPYSSTHSTEEN